MLGLLFGARCAGANSSHSRSIRVQQRSGRWVIPEALIPFRKADGTTIPLTP